MINYNSNFCAHNKTTLFAVITIALIFILLGLATVNAAEPTTKRPKIGLALGGGGARGAAHIGIIKVLEELRIPVDFVTGTSIGSIVGGLYASGMSSEELETTILNIDWDDAFNDATKRESLSFRQKERDFSFMVKSSPGFREGKIILPAGLIDGQKLNFMLKALTLPVVKITNFDELAIPYRAIATDIETGEAVVLKSGDLAYAMRASMSVPGVFSPIRIDGKLLVDGGMVNNVPIDVARAMGADIIIAVDVGTPPLAGDNIKSVLDITDQLTRFMIHGNVMAQLETLKAGDILIRPDLGDLGSGEFERSEEGIAIGEKAAREILQQLKKLSLSEAEFDAYLAEHESNHEPITLDFIKIINNSSLADDVIEARIHAKLGEETNLAILEKDFGSIYGLDIFERVDYQIVTEAEKTGLMVNSISKSWGPNYLQFGIKLADDFNGENSYDIGVSYTMTELNHLGADWRTEINIGETPRFFTEFYQPLDRTLHYFISPHIEYKSRNVNRFSSGDLIAQYRISYGSIGLEGGRQIGTWGEFRFGLHRSTGEAKLRIGAPTLNGFKFDDGNFFGRFSYDKIDYIHFPKHGTKVSAEWSSHREELGSGVSFSKLFLKGAFAHTWDKNTIVLAGHGVTVSDENIPLQYSSPLGGFLKLSGFHENELYGNHLLIGKSVYYRKINDISYLPAYLGISVEAGNVWNSKDEIGFDSLIWAGSIFLGVDSFLGPVYLGFGNAEGGHNSFYLYLGKSL